MYSVNRKMIPSIICNKYAINSLLGNGKFGTVYEGTTKEQTRVAIKTEPKNSEYKLLRHEVTILNYLFYSGTKNIPRIYWFCQHQDHTCLVMTHFSCSLHDYIMRKGKLEQRKLASIMIKCIDLLESIHKYHIVHRDIKPQNFMCKDGDLYMIDFGLSTVFVDENGDHICKRDTEHVIGSPRYISFYNHCGEPMSRRDDLISLGYMYLFMRNGNLPWDSQLEHTNSTTDIHSTSNIYRKNEKSWGKLGDTIDGCIHMYLKYCYELKYNDIPNYHILMELFT
jgi:serine/threonine protein kinase